MDGSVVGHVGGGSVGGHIGHEISGGQVMGSIVGGQEFPGIKVQMCFFLCVFFFVFFSIVANNKYYSGSPVYCIGLLYGPGPADVLAHT